MDTRVIILCLALAHVSFGDDGASWLFSGEVYNASDRTNLFRDSALHTRDNFGLKCTVHAVDEGVHTVINQLQFRAKLIQYQLNIVTGNYTVNPLLVNQTHTYKSDKWARVGSSQGETILNLAFNYDVLSLKTLSFGIEKLDIDLAEEPEGCLGKLTEYEKIQVVLDVMLRDFNADGAIEVFEGESTLCHQVIQDNNGTGKFTDRCCFQAMESIEIVCYMNKPNYYLQILDVLLVSLSMVVFLFGLAFVPSWLYTSTMDNIQYYVKLKEPLYKTMVVTNAEDIKETNIKHKHFLRVKNDFPNFFNIVSELPKEVVIPIKIDQFDIDVSYRKMMVEQHVPVGIMSSLARAIFQCKLHELGPFEECCSANVTGCLHKGRLSWKNVCSLFGRILFVISLPSFFYVRLLVYYFFEYPEIVERSEAADNLGLVVDYEFRIMQFLTPTHPLYITMYVFYFAAGIRLAYTAGSKRRPHMQTAIIAAFHDMHTKSKLKVLSFSIYMFLWPFKKYGIYGIFLGVVYWPIVMPFVLVPAILYSIPLVYVMIRIIQRVFVKHPLQVIPPPEVTEEDEEEGRVPFKVRLQRLFNIGGMKRCRLYSHHPVMNIIFTFVVFITIFAMMTMIAEVARFLAEIMCFTVMGLIVNAAQVIKYGSMLFMVILYSRDCYDDVNRKYLKLNKALFNEVQRQLGKDIAEFTQLPESLQANRGFKAVEASAQGEHEETDDLVTSVMEKPNWSINDLILFIDQRDTPRMPKKLFDQVCEIKVAGSPGPVYKSLIMATGKFMFIILFLAFVFIVVMSFGESNNFSQSSQMLAAMVGGFLPLIFNNLLKSATPQVETNLLTFKAKVNEIITQFQQTWPMTDFIFDVEEPPKEEGSEEEDDGETSQNSHKSNKEKENGNDDKGNEHKGQDDKGNGGKEKKDNGKDDKGKENNKDDKEPEQPWFVKTKVNLEEIRRNANSLHLPPADGKEVDILVQMLDWQFDSSTLDISPWQLVEQKNNHFDEESAIGLGMTAAGVFALTSAMTDGNNYSDSEF